MKCHARPFFCGFTAVYEVYNPYKLMKHEREIVRNRSRKVRLWQ